MGVLSMALFGELKRKPVISVSSGKSLGRISDATIDADGKIVSLQITRRKSVLPFAQKQAVCSIGWESIVKYSEDVVLVNVNDALISSAPPREKDGMGTLSGYFAAALLIFSVLIFIKSCVG